MNINELRIGICYNWYAEGKYYSMKVEPKDFTNDNYKNFYPIELSKEILLKYGFVEGKNNWFGLKYFTDCEDVVEEMKIDYNLISKRLSIYDAIEETDMVNILSYPIYAAKKIEYLHELQNIYFSLTSKELSVVANGS
jgi:hypothetical protein